MSNEENSKPPAIWLAVKDKDFKKVAEVLNKKGLKKDDTWIDYQCLIRAILTKKVDIVNLLLKYGCRVKGKPPTKKLCTPLYYAVQAMEKDWRLAQEIILTLLKAGASITDKDKNEETPLILAMKNRNMSNAVNLILSNYDVKSINPENQDEFTHFVIACINNKSKLVENFIKKGMTVNTVLDDVLPGWAGSTPLHLAVKDQAGDTVKILLTHGADYTRLNANGQTPIHLAYYFHEEKQQMNSCNGIMDSLLLAHSNNFINPIDENGLSHFHVACLRNNIELVNKFLQHGVDLKKLSEAVKDASAVETPLNLAVKHNHRALIKVLIDHNADINAKGKNGLTPLALAIECKDFKIAEVLLKFKPNVCIEDDKGNTPIHRAFEKLKEADNNRAYGMKVTSEKLQDPGKILDLMLSYHGGKMENVINKEGMSIFHIACRRKDISIVKNFLENNIDVNARVVSKEFCKNNGYTALHHAAATLNKELIELLLKYKADVNAVDENGKTPLEVLIESQPCEKEKMKKFFKDKFSKKLDTFDDLDSSDCSRSEDDFTIHCTLCQSGDGHCHAKKKKIKRSNKPLLDADEGKRLINLVYQKFKHIEMIELLVKNNANLNHKDKQGNPLLFNVLHKNIFNFISLPKSGFSLSGRERIDPRITHITKRYFADNFRKIMKIFVHNGADLNVLNRSGNTILHEISEYMRIKVGRNVLLELAGLVLRKGCNPYVLNKKGHLAITHAIRYRYIGFLETVLKHYFNPNCVDGEYGTPLHQAVLYSYNDQGDRYRHNEMIMMLLIKGADINAVNSKGRTPLFKAFRSSPCTPPPMGGPGQKNPGKAIELLLDQGADVSVLDKDGRTALFLAAIRNNPHCLHVLLDNGVDVNVVDKYGMTVMKKLFTYITPTNIKNETYNWIIRLLATHFKKLQLLGRPVIRDNLLYCKRLRYACYKGIYPKGLKDMFADEVDVDLDLTNDDKKLTTVMKNELKKMADTKINEFSTLYNILFKDLQHMIMYLKNENFKKYLDDSKLYKEFPHFGMMLVYKYKQALARTNFAEAAEKSFNHLTCGKLPQNCIDKVFTYLSNEDSENLSKV